MHRYREVVISPPGAPINWRWVMSEAQMDPYKGWNEVANNGVSAHAAADETRAKRKMVNFHLLPQASSVL